MSDNETALSFGEHQFRLSRGNNTEQSWFFSNDFELLSQKKKTKKTAKRKAVRYHDFYRFDADDYYYGKTSTRIHI